MNIDERGPQSSAAQAEDSYQEIGTTGELDAAHGGDDSDTSTTAPDADHIGSGGD